MATAQNYSITNTANSVFTDRTFVSFLEAVSILNDLKLGLKRSFASTSTLRCGPQRRSQTQVPTTGYAISSQNCESRSFVFKVACNHLEDPIENHCNEKQLRRASRSNFTKGSLTKDGGGSRPVFKAFSASSIARIDTPRSESG